MANEMPIKYQVCTREQGEELAELLGDDAPGSLRVWVKHAPLNELQLEIVDKDRDHCDIEYFYPAYTGDELGALLPTRLNYKMKSDEYFLAKDFDDYGTIFANGYLGIPHLRDFRAKTEAQAKAELLIKLLQDKWIKPEDVKYPDFN